MTYEDAKKLKNGQYIQVNIRGEWIDALFIRTTIFYGKKNHIYAQHMGFDPTLWQPTSIYGTCSFFDLDEVRLPIERLGK